MEHLSNSAIQKQAEIHVMNFLEKENPHLSFEHEKSIRIGESFMIVDIVCESTNSYYEVYAIVEKIHGSQWNKIKADVLKLNLIEKQIGRNINKSIVFIDKRLDPFLKNKSWLNEAFRLFKINIEYADVPTRFLKELKTRKEKQAEGNRKS